mgnify:CR=1 FL=1
MSQCTATTRAGSQCKKTSSVGDTVCHVHAAPRPGQLYVLSNTHMTGLKIGMTTGEPSARARALSTTGVAIPFVVEHETRVVADPAAAEKRVFAALADQRISDRREFFDVSVEDAIAATDAATSLPCAGAPFVVDVPDGVTEIIIRVRALGVAPS